MNRPLRTFLRATDAIFDGIGARPVGLFAFAASAGLLWQLHGDASISRRAQAVASAHPIEHPTQVASFVISVAVQPGEVVAVGQPLAELAARPVELRIARVDARLERLSDERKLALAELAVSEERWVDSAIRVNPRRPSVADETRSVFDSEREALQARRAVLVEALESLVIRSRFAGRVARIAGIGESVEEGSSLATVLPEHASEIVAYLPAATDPATVTDGSAVKIATAASPSCDGLGRVLRRGAAVEQAPGQLRGFLQTPVYGLPVHVSLPRGCKLGVGQVLSVDLRGGIG